MPGMGQYKEEGVMAAMLIFAHFKAFKLKYFINEWTPGLDILTGT